MAVAINPAKRKVAENLKGKEKNLNRTDRFHFKLSK